jgi:hypothetical protein
MAGYASASVSAAQLGITLSVDVVHAGRRGEEESVELVLLRREKQMRADENVQHASRAIALDESHATHVGGEVVALASVA